MEPKRDWGCSSVGECLISVDKPQLGSVSRISKEKILFSWEKEKEEAVGPSPTSYNLWTDLKDTVFSETNPPLSNNAWLLLTEASEVDS